MTPHSVHAVDCLTGAAAVLPLALTPAPRPSALVRLPFFFMCGRSRRRAVGAGGDGSSVLGFLAAALCLLAFGGLPGADAATKWHRESTGTGGPGQRSGAAGVMLTGSRRLFVVGGETGAGRLLKNDAWSFDYAQKRWMAHNVLPGVDSAGRAYAAAAAVDPKVVVYGGQCTVSLEAEAGGTPCADYLWEFNLLYDTWTRLDTLTEGEDPGPRMGATLVKGMGSTLYAFGGTKGGDRGGDWGDDVAKHVFAFDVNNRHWTKLIASTAPSWPSAHPFVPRYGHAAVYDTLLSEMVVYGGEMGDDQGSNTWSMGETDIVIFNTQSKTWTRRHKRNFAPRKWAMAALHRTVSNQPTPRSLLIVAGYGREYITHSTSFDQDRTGIMSFDFQADDCCWSNIRPDVSNPVPEARHGMVGGMLDGTMVSLYGGATCVKTNGGLTQQCRAQFDDVWTYDMSGQRVETGRVTVTLAASAAAAPLGGGQVDELFLLIAGTVHTSERLSAADGSAVSTSKAFGQVPAQEVVALALKDGIIVAAARGNVIGEDTVTLAADLVNASTLNLRLLREDGHSPYENAPATVRLYSEAYGRNVSQPGAACVTDVNGKCSLSSLPTEPPMSYLQGLNAVGDFTGSDATLVFSASGGGGGSLCEKRASIGRAPCCGQEFTCITTSTTITVKELPLTTLSPPTPGSVGVPTNHSGVTTKTQMTYLRLSYAAAAAHESQRVQLLVSAPATDGGLAVYASLTYHYPNPTTVKDPARGVTSAVGETTATTRADGSGRPGLEAELLVDIGTVVKAAAAVDAGAGVTNRFVYVGISVTPPGSSTASSPFYLRARIESKLPLVIYPPPPVPSPPNAPPGAESTIPGTDIAVPGGPAAVAAVLASFMLVTAILVILVLRHFWLRRERRLLEAKLRAEGRLPGGGGAKPGPWRPPMADVEEALGEKFNDNWRPGDGPGQGHGVPSGSIQDELEEAHRSARPISSEGISNQSRRAGNGAPLSPEMGYPNGGNPKVPGMLHDGRRSSEGEGLHPDVVGAYFAARNVEGDRPGRMHVPGMQQKPPSRGAYAEEHTPRPFTPETQARGAEAASRGDVAGYMENVDAMADEYFRSLMGGDVGPLPGMAEGDGNDHDAPAPGFRPMSANTVTRSTEALREKYKKLAGEGKDARSGTGETGGASLDHRPIGRAPPPPPGVAPPPGPPGAGNAPSFPEPPRAPPGIMPPRTAPQGNADDGAGPEEDVDILRMRKHLAQKGLRPTTPSSAGVEFGTTAPSVPPWPPSPPLSGPTPRDKPPPPTEEHPDDVARRQAALRREAAAMKKARLARDALRAKIEGEKGREEDSLPPHSELPPLRSSPGRPPLKSILKKR